MGFRRCNVRGRLTGDIWQFGFVLQSDEQLQIMSDAVAAAINTMLAGTANVYPTSVLWDDVVCSELEVGTGRVTEVASSTIANDGTGVATPLPAQCSVVVSILPITGTSTGRFYLPPWVSARLDSNGGVGVTDRTDQLAAWKSIFDALSARTSPARLGIWRTSTQSFVGARALSLGSVIDTQRRRRNKRVETRAQAVLAL